MSQPPHHTTWGTTFKMRLDLFGKNCKLLEGKINELLSAAAAAAPAADAADAAAESAAAAARTEIKEVFSLQFSSLVRIPGKQSDSLD